MRQKIQIEKSCTENFNSMSTLSDGKFCGVCQTKVVDFTKMSLFEIEGYFKNNSSQKICGLYNARHTNKSNSFTLVNGIENFVFKTRFRKMAVWTISFAFFLVNSYKCMGKRVERPVTKNDKRTTQNDTLTNKK